jgi:hypothetical protein
LKVSGAYGRVALLGLARLAGEDDQAGLVRLQALNVDRLALLAQVPATVVDDDAEPERLLAGDAGLLELPKREAAALADLAVVAHSRRAHGRPQLGERAHAEGRSLSDAGVTAAELAPGLVEPGADVALPVLAEVVAGEDCRQQR